MRKTFYLLTLMLLLCTSAWGTSPAVFDFTNTDWDERGGSNGQKTETTDDITFEITGSGQIRTTVETSTKFSNGSTFTISASNSKSITSVVFSQNNSSQRFTPGSTCTVDRTGSASPYTHTYTLSSSATSISFTTSGGNVNVFSISVNYETSGGGGGTKYTLAWDSNGGSTLSGDYSSGSITSGDAISAPDDPTKTNYTFDGWKTNNDGTGTTASATMPAANTTYYAAWKQTVTLNTGLHGDGANKTPYVYLNGTALSDNAVHSASEWTLLGYYTATTGGTKVLKANGSFAEANVTDYITDGKWSRTGSAPTLYAQWEKNVSLTWNVQVNVAGETLVTSSTAPESSTYVSQPTNLVLNSLSVTSGISSDKATNKISTTKDKGGYISATFDVKSGYAFVPKYMTLKTTAVSEAKTVEVNVGDDSQTWNQSKSGSAEPTEHTYTFANPHIYTGTITMKIYVYGGDDGTKGFRLGTPIEICGTIMPTTVSGTISSAGWSTFSSPYPLDLTGAVSNGTVYYASASDGSTVTLAEAPSQVVPAGEGLMIKGTAGNTFTIQTSGEVGTTISGNLLKGQTTTGNVSAENHYVFGYVTATPSTYGFYALTAATEVPAGKAYLEYPAVATAPSFLRIIEEENNATSIDAIGSEENAVKFFENGQLYILREGVVYDALGRKVR